MRKLDFYIGLCVLESEELALEVAGRIKEDLKQFSDSINLTFKGSFDKANRTSIRSFRGQGIDNGLAILERVKKEIGLPVLTDFHYPDQADRVASIVDTIQVPAFLCRQTDMIVEGAKAATKYNRELKIKKGQFLSPYETKNIVEKASEFISKDKIILTERGVSFGYNNLIVDMASFQIMKSFGVRAVHDATHCVQMPGALGEKTGGKRDQVFVLAKAAVAAGADGVFIETHPNPDQALSDSSTCIDIIKIKDFVDQLVRIFRAV